MKLVVAGDFLDNDIAFLLEDDKIADIRITSYNVCYTKLLRKECIVKGDFLLTEAQEQIPAY